MTYRAHKIKMLPSKQQITSLNQMVGDRRFVADWTIKRYWEYFLSFKRGECPFPKYATLWREFYAFRNEGPDWLKQTPTDICQHAVKDVCAAYDRYWEARKHWEPGKPKPKRPEVLKKGKADSFYVAHNHERIVDKTFNCTGIGKIRLTEKPRFNGKVKSYVVSKKYDEWYVSVLFQLEDQDTTQKADDSVVGVDIGVKNSVTLSTGEVYRLPKPEYLQNKLHFLERKFGRAKKGSKRYYKLKDKLNRLRNRIACIMDNGTHEITTEITKSHGKVVLETLSVKSMYTTGKGTRINKAINKARMKKISYQLAYKAKEAYAADRYCPTSQMCSHCGNVKPMPPNVRVYKCDKCGLVLDRDINAARNILEQYVLGLVTPIKSCG